jgi:Patatin-like phospholipase
MRESTSECLPLWKVLLAEYKRLYDDTPKPEPTNLDEVVALLHTKDRGALCVSGGGIRSASFALGVIQGLAKLGASAKDSVLNKIDYLSTVSGGGYVGSWLSGWATRKQSMEAVIEELRKKPVDKLKPEPGPLHHLREYSNYLTPKLGLLSADTWAFFGSYFRNLFLMWVVLIPFFLGVLALPRFFVSLAMNKISIPGESFQYAAVALFLWALAFVGLTRPTAKPTPKTWFYSNPGFQILCLLPLCLFAATLVIGHAWFPFDQWENGLLKMIGFAVLGTLLSSVIYTIRKVRAEGAGVWKQQLWELMVSAVGGVFLAVVLYQFLVPFPSRQAMAEPSILSWLNGHVPLLSSSVAAAYIVFGIPLVLLALLLQATLFIGGTGRFNGDFDREWWGRAGAWLIIAGLGWIVISAVVIYGPAAIYYAPRTIAMIGGGSGLVALGAGRSSKTGANDKQKEKESTTGAVSNILLGLATPLFALALLAALSLGTTLALRVCLEKASIIKPRPDQSAEIAFLKQATWTFEQKQKPEVTQVAPPNIAKLGTGEQKLKTIEQPAVEADKLDGLDHLFVIENTPLFASLALVLGSILIAILASWLIGVNRFSMHALYRDRIIRGYLAASNEKREPNPFTGFDPNDNIPISSLLKRPMHMVNMCLNLASGDDLAWQERKAESFTASPLHCGSLNLGYRPSTEYGGPQGMKLGTAVGISGAAASPNMGYHSSPALALILTFFNVRLGWWLGNPTDDITYKLDNPLSSLKPLLAEALGMSDKKHSYIYLSDGGHFENLGLYEMVLRRCRHIVVSDAGSDEKFIFDDLGMAIRKIYIDFGIRVVIDRMGLFPRSLQKSERDNPKYCATGSILYSEVDKGKDGKVINDGLFVYFKPVFYGNEPQDIYNYGTMNEAFPHQSTGDQFFSESQLESYRGLGEFAIDQVCGIKGTSQEEARKGINSMAEFIKRAQDYTNEKL